jgi:hypothetical protein
MRFSGNVGYGINTEIRPGVWQDVITEKSYFGDVVRNSRHLQTGEAVNDDLTVSNSVSIVADAFGLDHIFAIRYVVWQGSRWKVSDVEVARPRLILRLGGVYNGPTA